MDKIEKLVRVSARLGMFDDLAKGMLEFAPSTVRFDIENVNYEDPTGDDAILLFRVGMGFVSLPHLSEFVNDMWRPRTRHEMREIYKEEVIQQGLAALHRHILRKHITERSKNAIQQGTHRQVP